MAASPPSADDAALIELAYNEATRTLAEQLSSIESFRNRAGLLLSAAAITTSVLGARAFDQGSIGYAAWAALGTFCAVALLSMAILWPRPREFAADSAQIIENCIGSGESQSVTDLYYALTLQMQRSCSVNRRDLSQLATLFEMQAA